MEIDSAEIDSCGGVHTHMLASGFVDSGLIRHFNKIRLLESIANQIAFYGVQCGNVKLMDYIDMNCGGIPEGNFSQIVDVAAPLQFLAMYTKTAENRFASAVTELVKMNGTFIEALVKSCFQVGKDMQIHAVKDADEAFKIYNSFILDGMVGEKTKEIISKTDEKITWKKLLDTHESAWKKAGGSLDVYYRLQQSFVSGLFEESRYTYIIEDNLKFSLKKCS